MGSSTSNRLHREHHDLPVTQTPVLIVGASLVGMTMAALLSHHGVKGVIAVEKHPGTAQLPRAALFHPRTMQIYRELGLYDTMMEKSRQHYDNNSGIVVLDTLAGTLMSTLMRNMNEDIGSISPTERIFLTQMMFEPLLKDRALQGGAELRFATEMVDFEQDDEGVTAVIAEARTGVKQGLIRAKYLVAADGNRSPVREALGIPLYGHGLLSRSVTIYFKAELSSELRTRFTGVIYVNNPKLRGFFRLDKVGKEDFLVVFAAGERRAEKSRFVADYITDELAGELLEAAFGIHVKYEITHVAKWEALCDNAMQYSKGRIFLAGDSSAKVTPHGGYGGNTGAQAAHNLAWKLALVLSGKAGSALLDTYHDERNPVGKQTVDQVYHHFVTRTAEEFMTDGWDDHINLVKDYFLELGYRYHSKALDTKKLGSIVEDPENTAATPGSIARHVMVQMEGTVDKIPVADLLGKHFVLLTGSQGQGWISAAQSLNKELSLPEVKAHRILNDKPFCERYSIDPDGAVLVRPDGFVAWSSAADQGLSRHDEAQGGDQSSHLLERLLNRLLCVRTNNNSVTSQRS